MNEIRFIYVYIYEFIHVNTQTNRFNFYSIIEKYKNESRQITSTAL